mmetsp:Transcript_1742/g.2416  ORF Transcript_1742/g.2416 Transcript_1742/m.2416 type:complete len:729 (+) Transcript_1742:106-2292(+)
MDEPFDELMGPPPINSKSRNVQTSADDLYSPSIVTPEPSPTEADATYSRQSSRSSGGAPPSNAFSHSSGPPSTAFSHSGGPPASVFTQEPAVNAATDRWNQFEMDDEQLREESAMATGSAVAAAATRAAMREASRPMDEFSAPTRRPYRDDPLEDAGSSLPHPEEYRSSTGTTSRGVGAKEILRNLKGGAARRAFGGQSRYRDEVEEEPEEEVVYDDPHDRVRAEALKMLELADGQASVGSAVHRTPSMDSQSPSRSSSRRVPAALAGLDAMKSSNRSFTKTRFRDDPFSIGSDDEAEYGDGDLVDVVARERGEVRDMDDYNGNDQKEGKSWSSRYSVSSTLESLQANRDHNRFVNSARMQHSPPREARTFGKGFSFTRSGKQDQYAKHNSPNGFNLQGHRTVWMDADGSGNLSPTGKQTWQSNLSDKRTRRRRACILVVVLFALGVVFTVLFSSLNKKKDGILYSGNGNGVGTHIAFYVTADTPWDEREDKKLSGDLAALPGDAEFLVHLGNIQDASVTLCPSSVYDDAYTVLSDSPVPVFIVPGQHDWNNCPNPENSMTDWKNNFVGFESGFDFSFATDHQLGRSENFAFIRRGVLFIGLHLVGGRVHDKDEWKKRHTDNVEWAEEKLNEDPDSYRAVVLLGNARPSQQQEDFFREVIDDVEKLGKPSLYLHANGGGGFMEYRPFDDVGNMLAVQLDDGGKTPPLRVNVDFGSRPFEIGSPVNSRN